MTAATTGDIITSSPAVLRLNPSNRGFWADGAEAVAAEARQLLALARSMAPGVGHANEHAGGDLAFSDGHLKWSNAAGINYYWVPVCVAFGSAGLSGTPAARMEVHPRPTVRNRAPCAAGKAHYRSACMLYCSVLSCSGAQPLFGRVQLPHGALQTPAAHLLPWADTRCNRFLCAAVGSAVSNRKCQLIS